MQKFTEIQEIILNNTIQFMKKSGTPDASLAKIFIDKSHAECAYRVAGNYHTDKGPHYKNTLTPKQIEEILDLQEKLDAVDFHAKA